MRGTVHENDQARYDFIILTFCLCNVSSVRSSYSIPLQIFKYHHTSIVLSPHYYSLQLDNSRKKRIVPLASCPNRTRIHSFIIPIITHSLHREINIIRYASHTAALFLKNSFFRLLFIRLSEKATDWHYASRAADILYQLLFISIIFPCSVSRIDTNYRTILKERKIPTGISVTGLQLYWVLSNFRCLFPSSPRTAQTMSCVLPFSVFLLLLGKKMELHSSPRTCFQTNPAKR